MSKTLGRAEIVWLAIFAFIGLVLIPGLNAWTPEGSWFHIADFTVNLWGKYLCYAILALGMGLLWGYTGLLSLCQCLFFSLGGYAIGMYLMLMIGTRGQYKSPLPDFMVFLGYPELPAHWVPFRSFGFAMAAVIIIPALVALVFGYLAFRSRVRGVYFSILTQALTYAACLMFFRNDFTFGGNNGLTDFYDILGFSLRDPVTKRVLFMITVGMLIAVYLFCRWLTNTKFGKVQRAIRDSEMRVLFSGYSTANFKLFVWVVSAIIAAIAGALYVPQVGIINPSEMSPEKSLEVVIWVAVGGRNTLIGPILGAIGVNALRSWASRAFPDYWLFILGGLFVLVVLFIPKGLAGLGPQLRNLWQRLFARKTPEQAVIAETATPPSESAS